MLGCTASSLPMASPTCLLSCLWEPVQAALLGFLGTAVTDCLASLRDRAVEQVRSWTFFWGNQVEQVPTSSADLVGKEKIRGYMREIGDYLKDTKVGVIGVYGGGGIGKTTLLEMINNKFREIGAPGFEVVIWVTVSSDPSILKIQKSIGERIGLSLSAEQGAGSSSQLAEEEQAKAIFKALSKRRFLLLLDDVWEELQLKQVGIPQPTAENKCKIILTTRSKEVCTNMDAKKLEVTVLSESESWKLFKAKVGTEVDLDNPRINPHAKAVAHKCGGLPLALITVGRAMAEAKSEGEWQEALKQLREAPNELPGMKDKVLSLVKFSFDRLGDENTKECLLYCCMFREDYEIPIKKLIEYWVGEGFLDNPKSDSILRARDRGEGVITKLKSACLLEDVNVNIEYFYGEGSVKMHDVVREMCLWLTGGQFDERNTFLVPTGVGLNHVPTFERWGDAKRISLKNNVIKVLPRNIPSCPNLQTLLFWAASFSKTFTIQQGFFEFMPVLRVLDLSWTRLERLPDDIGFLTELRYLNLHGTRIRSLPKGLGKLTNLSQLNLDQTPNLSHIPLEVIPTLTGLRVFGLYASRYEFGQLLIDEGTSSSSSPTWLSMQDKESCWSKLEELRLSVTTWFTLEMLLKFDRLRRCTIDLQIYLRSDITAERVSKAFRRLEKLRKVGINGHLEDPLVDLRFDGGSEYSSSLEMLSVYKVSKITVVLTSPCSFEKLRSLKILCCHGIHDLTWARQLRCLQTIEILDCLGIEELLSTVDGVGGAGGGSGDHEAHGGCDCSSLLSLEKMALTKLPALKSISKQPLRLPSLKYLRIKNCPQLKKLPLGPRSAPNIKIIKADKEWWEGLEWYHDVQGQSVEPRFLPYFQSSE